MSKGKELWIARNSKECNGRISFYTHLPTSDGEGNYIQYKGDRLFIYKAESKAFFGFIPRFGECRKFKLVEVI